MCVAYLLEVFAALVACFMGATDGLSLGVRLRPLGFTKDEKLRRSSFQGGLLFPSSEEFPILGSKLPLY